MELQVSIRLNKYDIEDVQRLLKMMQEESPSLYSDYTLEKAVEYVAGSGFDESLRSLTKFYAQKLEEKN